MLETMPTTVTAEAWPALPIKSWEDTRATLHLWTQVVGKVCLDLTPLANHYWNIAFHMTPRGLTTPVMTAAGGTFTITFDLVEHQLVYQFSDGRTRTTPLRPQTVADFYRETMATLEEMGIKAHVWPVPTEIPNPIRFTEDVVHHSYDPVWANAFWRAMLSMKPVFEGFRCDFIGKSSPLHFFWGSFDLALTRFSGRRAPERADPQAFMREAYSHEVISHGFWPGNGPEVEAAFYAYSAPEPPGFKEMPMQPAAAVYNKELSIFVLPYEAVRSSKSPVRELSSFMSSTYEAAAKLAEWNRAELERR
jgi:hypothetical protein